MMIWGIFFSYGVFFTPLINEFGVSSTEISIAFSLHLIVFSLSTILMGRLTDKYGPRLAIGLGTILVSSGLILSSFAGALEHLYVTFGVLASIGAGAIYVPPILAISKWFKKKRGFAIGIAANGYSVGVLLMAPFSDYLIHTFTWQTAFLTLGILAFVIMSTATLLMKSAPEATSVGISKESANAPTEKEHGDLEKGYMWSVRTAIRTASLWMLLGIYTISWLVFSMVMIYIVPLGLNISANSELAALSLSFIGMGGIVGKIVAGFMSDRIGGRQTLLLCFIVQSAALLSIAAIGDLYMLYALAFIFGFSVDGSWIQIPIVTSRYFGLASMGAIFGLIEGFASGLGGGLGPLIGGIILDLTASYNLAFFLAAILSTLGSLISFIIKSPVTTEPLH